MTSSFDDGPLLYTDPLAPDLMLLLPLLVFMAMVSASSFSCRTTSFRSSSAKKASQTSWTSRRTTIPFAEQFVCHPMSKSSTQPANHKFQA